jgi:hypothetical protein
MKSYNFYERQIFLLFLKLGLQLLLKYDYFRPINDVSFHILYTNTKTTWNDLKLEYEKNYNLLSNTFLINSFHSTDAEVQ